MTSANEMESLAVGFERDQRRLNLINRVTILIPILNILFLFYLLLVTENWSSALVALSLHGIFTRLSYMVAFRAYLYPKFMLEFVGESSARREEAEALLAAHRKSVLYEIQRERLEPTADEALEAIQIEEIASWDEVRDIDARRRFGKIWLVVWVVVSVIVYSIVYRAL